MSRPDIYFLRNLGRAKKLALSSGLVLGFAAGVVNIVRVASAYNRANPPDPNAPRIPDDDD